MKTSPPAPPAGGINRLNPARESRSRRSRFPPSASMTTERPWNQGPGLTTRVGPIVPAPMDSWMWPEKTRSGWWRSTAARSDFEPTCWPRARSQAVPKGGWWETRIVGLPSTVAALPKASAATRS